jgi:hypothetical protein
MLLLNLCSNKQQSTDWCTIIGRGGQTTSIRSREHTTCQEQWRATLGSTNDAKAYGIKCVKVALNDDAVKMKRFKDETAAVGK